MSLTFSASTDLVNCGSGAAITNLQQLTTLNWLYQTSEVDCRIWQKGIAADPGGPYHYWLSNTTEYQLVFHCATADCIVSVAYASMPAFALNKWYFVAASHDVGGSTSNQHIWAGDLNHLAVEASSYSSNNVGSGGSVSESGLPLILGNKRNGSSPYTGRIALQMIFRGILSLGQVQYYQFKPPPTDRARRGAIPNLLEYHVLGLHGTGFQPDFSGYGNHGAVTGTTVSGPVPIPSLWTPRLYRAVKAPGGTTFNQTFAGTLTSSGALVKTVEKPLAGTLTSSGGLVQTVTKVLSGTLTSAGALVKTVTKPLAGTLTSSGSLVRKTTKVLAGTLTSSGALTNTKVIIVVLAGTLTSSGALVRQTTKALGGTLSPSGALVRQVTKILSGTLTMSGSLAKTIKKILAGVLTAAGALINTNLGASAAGTVTLTTATTQTVTLTSTLTETVTLAPSLTQTVTLTTVLQ